MVLVLLLLKGVVLTDMHTFKLLLQRVPLLLYVVSCLLKLTKVSRMCRQPIRQLRRALWHMHFTENLPQSSSWLVSPVQMVKLL